MTDSRAAETIATLETTLRAATSRNAVLEDANAKLRSICASYEADHRRHAATVERLKARLDAVLGDANTKAPAVAGAHEERASGS